MKKLRQHKEDKKLLVGMKTARPFFDHYIDTLDTRFQFQGY